MLRGNYAFEQNRIALDETATPGYALINVSMGASVRVGNQPLELNITLLNMLDKKYVDHLSMLKEVGFYNPGRNISLSLRIPFQVSVR